MVVDRRQICQCADRRHRGCAHRYVLRTTFLRAASIASYLAMVMPYQVLLSSQFLFVRSLCFSDVSASQLFGYRTWIRKAFNVKRATSLYRYDFGRFFTSRSVANHIIKAGTFRHRTRRA